MINNRIFQILIIFIMMFNHVIKKDKISQKLNIKLYSFTPISQMHINLIDYLKLNDTRDILSTIILNLFHIFNLIPLMKNDNYKLNKWIDFCYNMIFIAEITSNYLGEINNQINDTDFNIIYNKNHFFYVYLFIIFVLKKKYNIIRNNNNNNNIKLVKISLLFDLISTILIIKNETTKIENDNEKIKNIIYLLCECIFIFNYFILDMNLII